MDITLSEQDLAFQQEVREFLDANLGEDLRRASRLTVGTYTNMEACMRWYRILAKKGWIAPDWPVEYGGTGWTDMQRYIFGTESFHAGAPLLFNMGIRHIGPVLIAHGTREQRDFYIPRILSGEEIWCQGYSEPSAGSDLASLKLKAVREGDDYVLNGTKMWTTGAHFAQRMFCLVRTSDAGKKQDGITFLVMPVDLPGISIEPIITLAGEHECNQVFFDNVRVPVANRVGEENNGWRVAKVLMQYARSNTINMAWVREGFLRVIEIAQCEQTGSGMRLIDDTDFRLKLSALEIQLRGVESLELRVLSAMSRDKSPGHMSSMLKTQASELTQKVSELKVEAIGYYGFPFQLEALDPFDEADVIGPDYVPPVVPAYLNLRSSTIASGSSEIQRDVLAKRVLGL
jgi:alkylation response protein AidB-like acyl-CoA dehydrogenase